MVKTWRRKLLHRLTLLCPWDLQVGSVDLVLTFLPFNFLLAVCGWPWCARSRLPYLLRLDAHWLPVASHCQRRPAFECTSDPLQLSSSRFVFNRPRLQKSFFYCGVLLIYRKKYVHRQKSQTATGSCGQMQFKKKKNTAIAVVMVIFLFHVEGEKNNDVWLLKTVFLWFLLWMCPSKGNSNDNEIKTKAGRSVIKKPLTKNKHGKILTSNKQTSISRQSCWVLHREVFWLF